MVFEHTESNVFLTIPKECFEYPGGGEEERTTIFRKLCVQNDDVYYVIMESKVFKYDHVLNYGTFTVDSDMVACLREFKSVVISYEYEEETMDRDCTISHEILHMLPFECLKMTISDAIKDQFGALIHGPNLFDVCRVVPNVIHEFVPAEKMFETLFRGVDWKSTYIKINMS